MLLCYFETGAPAKNWGSIARNNSKIAKDASIQLLSESELYFN